LAHTLLIQLQQAAPVFSTIIVQKTIDSRRIPFMKKAKFLYALCAGGLMLVLAAQAQANEEHMRITGPFASPM
jgi:hypothetical protein